MFKPNTALLVDPILDIPEKTIFPIIKGGWETNHRTFVSNSYNNFGCQFSVPPPTPGTVISKRFLLRHTVQLTIRGTIATNPVAGVLLHTGSDAFRQFPLASIMKNIILTINGCSFDVPVNDIIKPLKLYRGNNNLPQSSYIQMSPSLRDNTQDYIKINTLINPLGTSAQTPRNGNMKPRGDFGMVLVNAVGPNINNIYTSTITAELTEELNISPLLFGNCKQEGFINITSLDINITWDVERFKLWCHYPGTLNTVNLVNITSIDVDMLNANSPPSILFEYITPPDNYKIPPSIQYEYNEINRYITNSQISLNYNELFNNVISNNIQIGVIPKYIYILIRKSNSAYGVDPADRLGNIISSCDSYAIIDNIKVNWDNRSTLLSNASQQQLYHISKRNGLCLDWVDFAGINQYASFGDLGNFGDAIRNGIGSVICLEVGKDIGLEDNEAPGCSCTKSFQITVSGKWKQRNYGNDRVPRVSGNLELVIITCSPGLVSIQRNSAYKMLGVVKPEDVLNARKTSLTWEKAKQMELQGGYH